MMSAAAEPATTPQQAVQRLSPLPRAVKLAQLFQDVAVLLEQVGKTQDIHVDWRVEPLDLTMRTDPGILRQLLTRLFMLFAARTTGAVTPQTHTVLLDAYQDDRHVTIRMSGDLEHIDSEDEGLLLCNMLARTLGTEIGFSEERGGRKSLSLTFQASPHLCTVLIIDDDSSTIELFRIYLTGLGYQVFGEAKAEAAVSRALELQPDAIVLDVMMPGMDGWELVQRLRHMPQLRNVPLIVCSALEEAELAAALGAAAFIKKPVLRPQLVKALEHAGCKQTS
jgi:CheY-like chemotaxis protein